MTPIEFTDSPVLDAVKYYISYEYLKNDNSLIFELPIEFPTLNSYIHYDYEFEFVNVIPEHKESEQQADNASSIEENLLHSSHFPRLAFEYS